MTTQLLPQLGCSPCITVIVFGSTSSPGASEAPLRAGGQRHVAGEKKKVNLYTESTEQDQKATEMHEATEKALKPRRVTTADLPQRARAAPGRRLPSTRGDLMQMRVPKYYHFQQLRRAGRTASQPWKPGCWGTACFPARVNTGVPPLWAGQYKYPMLKGMIRVWPGLRTSCL